MYQLINLANYLINKLIGRFQRNPKEEQKKLPEKRPKPRTVITVHVPESKSTAIKPNEPEMSHQGTPLHIIPARSIDDLHLFLRDHKRMMYDFLVNQMTRAVREDWPAIDLFRVGNTSFVARIDKTDYQVTLNDAQRFYIKEEDYEQADRCKKLMDRHALNLVINPPTME